MSKKELNKSGKGSKVTQLLEDIDLNLIQDIELDEKIESTVNREKIKNKALQHAKASLEKQEEQEAQKVQANSVINMKEKRAKRKSGFRRGILIPLVAILSLIGAAIAATGSNTTLRNFFGELFPYEDQVQAVGKKQIKSGIIYTVEGAFIDNKSGLFIVSMTKEDGSSFDSGVRVKQMRLMMEQSNGMGWNTTSYLEDNNKKLVSIMRLSSSKTLYNKELTLSAENIIQQIHITEPTNLNLDKIYAANQFGILKGNEINWYDYKQEDGLQIHPVEAFKVFSVDDVRISEKGLSILASYPDVPGVDERWADLALTDTRNHKEYTSDIHTKWCEEEQLNKKSFVFEEITAADLPYLKVNFIDDYEEMKLQETWQASFKLSKNSQVKSKRIFQMVKREDRRSLFTQVDVSALGVTLRGYGNAENCRDFSVEVVMEDGSEISFGNAGYSGGMGSLVCYYQILLEGENHVPELIDIEKVVGVKVDGKFIKL